MFVHPHLLDRALELDPKRPEFYYSRGLVHLALRQYPQAEQAFEAALALQPDSTRFRLALGEVHKSVGAFARQYYGDDFKSGKYVYN